MYTTQCLLAFVALYVGLAHSWEFAVSAGDRLEFYINDTKTDTVRLDSQNPSALAYDEVHDILLYVDKQSENDAICGYNISFVEYKCYMKRSGRDIQGLAFDPITQYLFFTDTKEKSINWISFQPESKNNVNILIKMDEGIPTDIAVDSCRGYVYWINTNLTTSTIERARFDGSDREVVINAMYKMDLHSLALDQKSKKIYWLMPENSQVTHLYSADLNGETKKSNIRFTEPDGNFITHPNALTVSKKNHLFVADWCANCGPRNVWKYLATSKSISDESIYRALVITEGKVGIVTNYKIAEQFEGIQECQPLTRLVPQTSLKIAREYEELFCVHGVKVHGESLCKCTPGYTGERCDVSVCMNYCMHGTCSFNSEGPECRCTAGYTGARCEVDSCLGYCLNNGSCSMNEESEPFCGCLDDYAGDRCELNTANTFLNEVDGPACQCSREDKNSTLLTTPTYYPALSNITLADLFANWRKPVIITPVFAVEPKP